MFSKQFKCTLMTDVILNQKSASEGPNSTLQFIPGSIFLGIAAKHYSEFGKDAFRAFHSDVVRFGDAHVANQKQRTLHVPASFFHPKYDLEKAHHYNYHLIQDIESIAKLNLKQSREGYYDFSCNKPQKIQLETNFSIKSAYDRDNRRSMDEKMYGYESLKKGLVFYFDIESTDEVLLGIISRSLVGEQHIGRSRSAQYGLTIIEETTYNETNSTNIPCKTGFYTVYADGRLIFMDSTGVPTFQPTAKDLGFSEDAEIVWDLSNIRTFQYAPYNGIRKSFDTDRCGIEKGSVFVVCAQNSPALSSYVGYYNNEGFGRVIYNPEFLNQSQITVSRESSIPFTACNPISNEQSESELLKFLIIKKLEDSSNSTIAKSANEWADKYFNCFKGDVFSSQWGKIRSIAYQSRNLGYSGLLSSIEEYIGHGVAAERWRERKRDLLLKEFLEKMHKQVPGNEWMALINLASVMQKMN